MAIISNPEDFYLWQASPLDSRQPPFNKCSPNLVAFSVYLHDRWFGQHLGCHHDREIIGGGPDSSHAYGSAKDWRYEDTTDGSIAIGRERALDEVLPWVISHHRTLGIQAIHDYAGGRIWRSWRPANEGGGGWKAQKTGSQMGQPWAKWFHFETNWLYWDDSTPIADRIGPAPTPPIDPLPEQEDDMTQPNYICKPQTNWWGDYDTPTLVVEGTEVRRAVSTDFGEVSREKTSNSREHHAYLMRLAGYTFNWDKVAKKWDDRTIVTSP